MFNLGSKSPIKSDRKNKFEEFVDYNYGNLSIILAQKILDLAKTIEKLREFANNITRNKQIDLLVSLLNKLSKNEYEPNSQNV